MGFLQLRCHAVETTPLAQKLVVGGISMSWGLPPPLSSQLSHNIRPTRLWENDNCISWTDKKAGQSGMFGKPGTDVERSNIQHTAEES